MLARDNYAEMIRILSCPETRDWRKFYKFPQKTEYSLSSENRNQKTENRKFPNYVPYELNVLFNDPLFQ